MESVGHWQRSHGGENNFVSRQDPPDVPGVVFGRLRNSQLGSALRASPVLVDTPLALVVCCFALVPLSPRGLAAAVVLLTIAAALPLCLRRRYPLTTFAVCAVVSFIQIVLWVPSFGTFSSLLIEFYTVAKWCSRRATTAIAATVTTWVICFCVRLPHVNATDKVAVALVFLPAAVAAGVLGVNANTRRAYVASITDRANRAERERDQQARLAAAGERSRIAREMHDIVAHNLSVMIALADGAGYTLHDLLGAAPGQNEAAGAPAGRPDTTTSPTQGPTASDERVRRAAKAVESVSATGREALAQMRSLLGVLRDDADTAAPAAAGSGAAGPSPVSALSGASDVAPRSAGAAMEWNDSAEPGLDGESGQDEPAMAPQPRIADLGRLVEQVRHAGPTVGLLVIGQRRELPTAAELTVFRIVQESLTNVLKHAGPRANAVVRLSFDPTGVDVEITNTGPSTADAGSVWSATDGPAHRSPGRGITGMRERAALHGGTLIVEPGADGWRVAARIVAPAGAAAAPVLGTGPSLRDGAGVPSARTMSTPSRTPAGQPVEGAPRP